MANYESKLKTVMGCGLGIAFVLGSLFLIVFVIRGMVWASEKTLPWLFDGSEITLAIVLFILLPLSAFQKTRTTAAAGFVLSSYVFGTLLLAFACIVAFEFWGYVGLIVGVCIAGVGVVPVAFLAALFHREWSLLLFLGFGLVLTFGIRAWGLRLAEPRTENEMSEIPVPFVCCPLCPDGWLVSSEHRDCFDPARSIWTFVCPDCGKPFEMKDDEIQVRNVPTEDLKQRYPALLQRRAATG